MRRDPEKEIREKLRQAIGVPKAEVATSVRTEDVTSPGADTSSLVTETVPSCVPTASDQEDDRFSFSSIFKDAHSRVEARQIIRLIRDPLILSLSMRLSKNDEDRQELTVKLAEFLKSPFGEALLFGFTGVVIHTKAFGSLGIGGEKSELSRELMVQGVASAEDAGIEMVVAPMREILAGVIAGVPSFSSALSGDFGNLQKLEEQKPSIATSSREKSAVKGQGEP